MLKILLLGIAFHFVYGFLRILENERWDLFGNKKDKDKAEQGISQAGQDLYTRGKMTPEEQKQYASSFDIGNLIRQLYQYQMGLGSAPSGYQDPTQQYLQQSGALGQALYGQTLQGIQDPNALYESTLAPQLQLAQDTINKTYQQRGLLDSGLAIEQMGRAGAELAIQEANARMQNRQQQMANAQSLQGNIYGQSQQNIGNLANLYGQQQQYGLQGMSRQAGQAQQAAQYQAYPYQYQLGQSGGNLSGLGTGLGMLAGGLLAAPTGGMSIPMGALIGGAVGGGTGSMFGY